MSVMENSHLNTFIMVYLCCKFVSEKLNILMYSKFVEMKLPVVFSQPASLYAPAVYLLF